jgi:hypothetical protein
MPPAAPPDDEEEFSKLFVLEVHKFKYRLGGGGADGVVGIHTGRERDSGHVNLSSWFGMDMGTPSFSTGMNSAFSPSVYVRCSALDDTECASDSRNSGQSGNLDGFKDMMSMTTMIFSGPNASSERPSKKHLHVARTGPGTFCSHVSSASSLFSVRKDAHTHSSSASGGVYRWGASSNCTLALRVGKHCAAHFAAALCRTTTGYVFASFSCFPD